MSFLRSLPSGYQPPGLWKAGLPHHTEVALLVVNNARQIFDCQRSDFFVLLKKSKIIFSLAETITFGFFVTNLLDVWWAWVDSNYRPHPYQGCALTN